MQIGFINYILASIVSYLGLLIGIILISLAPEEQKPGRKYFIFLKMILFLFIIALFLFFYEINLVFSLALLASVLVLIFYGKLHLENSLLVYSLFGLIFYFSSKIASLFVFESVLILLYGIPNSSLIINSKKNNYKEILLKNLWFFLPIVILYLIA